MIKSMTGFSKAETNAEGITATVEVKSLNGRYLEVNYKAPKSLSYREIDVRDIIKSFLSRGSITVNINMDYNAAATPLNLNEEAAAKCYQSLASLSKSLKIKEAVKLEHLLAFSNIFMQKDNDDKSELEWDLVKNALKDSLKNLEKMRVREGQFILKDIQNRIKRISNTVENIETLGMNIIPRERERLRQRIAQLFESDEIDEHRIQMEIVIVANRLDISEECVRLRSHIKFFFDLFKSKEPSGQKFTFILQEMHREINTIGSKADDAEISQLVVGVKEELERIREQVQNIE